MELAAGVAGPAPEVCISPGRATALVFDSPLRPEQVELEESGRFLLVEPGRLGLLLVPSEALRIGERLKLAVRLADGSVPKASADFTLVAHPTRGARQVDVYRRPRTAGSLHAELLQKEAELRRLEEEHSRLHTELSRAGNLVGLHASGLMDERGVSAHTSTQQFPLPPGSVLTVRKLVSQRSARRVAVLVELENQDTSRPWMARSARLTSDSGTELEVAEVSQPNPIPPGDLRRLIIEAKASDTEARGTYALTLSEADGLRSVTLDGVTFPELVMKR